jgi:hypothetical protein
MSGPRAVNDALAARSPPKDIIASVNYRLDTGFQQLPDLGDLEIPLVDA